MENGGIKIEIIKICGNCRFWDWYYCEGNEENEETGEITIKYGYCSMKGGWNGGWFSKDEPACKDFETNLCTTCGEPLKLERPIINEQMHVVWRCPKGHMLKCDTCGAHEEAAIQEET